MTLQSHPSRASYFTIEVKSMTTLRVSVSQARSNGMVDLAPGPVRLVLARQREHNSDLPW
jgi:hypothetical protein